MLTELNSSFSDPLKSTCVNMLTIFLNIASERRLRLVQSGKLRSFKLIRFPKASIRMLWIYTLTN